MTELERRYTPVPVEVRAKDSKPKIGGYAAKFDKLSQNLGGFVEKVSPGFFNDSRSRGWPGVIARYNHDDNMLLGTTSGRTLTLEIDNTGLLYEVDPPTSMRQVVEWIERGDVANSSFAFRALEEDWGLTDQGFPLRTLLSGQLVDVAPVSSPAYLDTSTGLRSADVALRSLAAKMNAPFEEVRSLAEQDDLRRFFVRTDKVTGKPKPTQRGLFGPAAAAALLARRTDPYV